MNNNMPKKISSIAIPSAILLLCAACSTPQPDIDAVYSPGSDVMKPSVLPENATARQVKSGYNFKSKSGRKLAHVTRLRITTGNVSAAIQKSIATAEKYNGYTLFSNNSSVRLKIPVDNAPAALKEIETFGEVTSRQLQATDITEHYVDVQVRLSNLKKMQKRLNDLLSQAKTVEDTLKIEKELSRITLELERYQAQMNNLNLRTSMVDINIDFKAVISEPSSRRNIVPASWIRDLGVRIVKDDFRIDASYETPPAKIAIPKNFVITSSNDLILKAAGADNSVIIMKKLCNIKDARLSYYQTMITRQLQYAGYSEIKTVESANKIGEKCLTFSANKNNDSYRAAIFIIDEGIFSTDEYVYVLELYGNSINIGKINFHDLIKSIEF